MSKKLLLFLLVFLFFSPPSPAYPVVLSSTSVSPAAGQTLSTPPLTVQCTNCGAPAGGNIAKQGARDATAQSWFVQDAAGGLNLQSTQLTISTAIADILTKMGDGTQVVDVSNLFTLNATTVTGNASLASILANQTNGTQVSLVIPDSQLATSFFPSRLTDGAGFIGVAGSPLIVSLDAGSGLATAANQVTGNTTLATLNLQATQALIDSSLNTIKANQTNGAQIVDVSDLFTLNTTTVTGNASLSSIDSKVTGLGTEATLALIKLKTDNLDVLLSTMATEATLAALNAKITNLSTAPVGTESGTLFRQVGPVAVFPSQSSVSPHSSFSVTTSSSVLVASNSMRGRIVIDATNLTRDLYVRFDGGVATIGPPSMLIYAGSRYDSESGIVSSGQITGISVAGGTGTIVDYSR